MKKLICLAIVAAVCLSARSAGATALAARPFGAHAPAVGESFSVSPLETRVLGRTQWQCGSPGALRVIVSDHRTTAPLDASVRIALDRVVNGKPSGVPVILAEGRTGPMGTLNVRFRVPMISPCACLLQVTVASALGRDFVEESVQLEQANHILLTVDKPVYQPGQTMHLRALALDAASHRAIAGQPLTLEVEDARGNKVFKQNKTLSRFGVASTDFVLADEVNMGVFTVRALLGSGQSEKKVRVERYVLPKFKIGISTDRAYYQPGDTVKGTVQTDYFFGKPVVGGEVTVTVNTVDIGLTRLAELQGKTDGKGAYTFEYALPGSFVGQPFEQGKAIVEFQVRVKDTAEHVQMQSKTMPVVKDPILIVMIPEAKQLAVGLPNIVYVACATPDGSPVKDCDLAISTEQGGKPAHIKTDALGVATYRFTPAPGQVTLTAHATAHGGLSASANQSFGTAPGAGAILLRTDRTFAKVGERLDLVALSSVKSGMIYVDVIRDRQTILTRAEEAKDGQASLTIPLTPDMTGTLKIHAYKILPNEEIIRDTRTVVVSPANDLLVSVTPDQTQYRPGADALLKFLVRTQDHQPAQAAIGLAIVDESVFALSELQPGLEKVYFMLEGELMAPKYEIHGLKPVDLLLRAPEPGISEGDRQRVGAMLLAAAPAAPEFDYRADTYQTRWAQVRDRAIEVISAAVQRIRSAAQKFRQDTGAALTRAEGLQTLVDRGYLQARDIEDPWRHAYRVELYGGRSFEIWFTLKSAGPDGRWGTADDLSSGGPLMVRRGRALGGFGGMAIDRMVRDKDMARAPMLGVPGPQGDVAEGVEAWNAPEAQRIIIAAKPMARAASAIGGGRSDADGGAPEPRVRQYFPETMCWNPEVITDAQGRAELHIPVADSITNWRMSLLANSEDGLLGSATGPLKVFQDFFVDIDLPVSLTQNDHISIPVAVYNYLSEPQDVALTLALQPWFRLEGQARQTVRVGKNEVRVVYFPLTVTTLGRQTLKVTARGTHLSDAIQRSIEVTPDGKEIVAAINDRLEKQVDKAVQFPESALPGSTSLWVKLYPGAFSQVVEGLDGLLRMPNGCFEQTSSTTYPNVLVTGYLKVTKKANPEMLMKADGYINIGYQRLVTFECKGGGFSWFGNEPAHQILTAYGLLEFSDMAKVHDVDPALIARTQRWLAGRQKADGTWPEDGQGIAEGIINRQTGALRSAAYIAWALAESGYQGAQVETALSYIREHRGEAKDAYTLAVVLNLLTKTARESDLTAEVANSLIGLAKQTDKAAWWEGDTETFTGAQKRSADLETTGLAAYGLLRWGRNAGFADKVLTYLVQSKDSYGTWETTQGTVWSMKALLFASSNSVGGGKGRVTVVVNGQKAQEFKITPDDSDVMRQIDLKSWLKPERNDVRLEYEGDGSLLYQIASRYYMPWDRVLPTPDGPGPLSIAVSYDKTHLGQNDTAQVRVIVKNNTDKIAEMPLIDLGVPPGFTVVADDLETAVQSKSISKYTLAQRQIIVYLEKLDPAQSIELHYAVKAKYPIKARTPLSRVYPYYNPEQASISAPQTIVVDR